AAGEFDDWFIPEVRRGRNNHLVPRIEYGPEDSVDALTAADSHQHFAIRIIMRTVPVFIIVADGLPECVEPRIMGILHRLRIDGVDGCLPDRLRCFKI